MPRAALSDDAIEAYRARTVAAGTKLFAVRGFVGVTMRAIAAELGDSPMTPYRYFENKDEIFAMVRAEAYRRFAKNQREAFESTTDPMGRLLAMRLAYLESALGDPDGYRVMFELTQAPEDRFPALAERTEEVFSLTVRSVEAVIEAGYIEGDALSVAHLLWAQIHGLISLHVAGKLTHGRTLDELRNLPAVMFKIPPA